VTYQHDILEISKWYSTSCLFLAQIAF